MYNDFLSAKTQTSLSVLNTRLKQIRIQLLQNMRHTLNDVKLDPTNNEEHTNFSQIQVSMMQFIDLNNFIYELGRLTGSESRHLHTDKYNIASLISNILDYPITFPLLNGFTEIASVLKQGETYDELRTIKATMETQSSHAKRIIDEAKTATGWFRGFRKH